MAHAITLLLDGACNQFFQLLFGVQNQFKRLLMVALRELLERATTLIDQLSDLILGVVKFAGELRILVS